MLDNKKNTKYSCYYTKDYFEEYARLCLNDFFNLDLIHREERHGSDRPDLISKNEKIGIEVTQAIDKLEGQRNKLFQYEYSTDETRNKQIIDNAKHLKINDLYFINKTAVLSGKYNKEKIYNDIKKSIETKQKTLLVPDYNRYPSNEIALFSHVFASDLENVCLDIQKLLSEKNNIYNAIYLINNEEICKITKYEKNIIELTKQKLSEYKSQATKFAKRHHL